MKKSILLLFMIASFASVKGQSCCKMNSNQQFSQLAMNDNFAAAHLSPLPYEGEKLVGKMTTFPLSDKTKGSAYIVMAKEPTNNWIFMYHEWWGLNDYIKHEADRLQANIGNCNVIAIDLYDGKIATEPKMAQTLSSGLDQKHAGAIVKGAINYSGKKAKIVTIGWCMGGGWSLQSTIMEGNQAIGCVIYYGMPEMDETKLSKIPCDIIGFYGRQDKFIAPEMINKFEEALNKAGVKNSINFYDAEHAFANPSNPKHNEEATAQSYEMTLNYIKEKFVSK